VISYLKQEVFDMSYIPITIDRKALTIMDVPFPDLDTLESAAEAIGSNMFEGFQPTRRGIEIIRDYCLGKISFAQLAAAAREKAYAE
jgi:putative transcriptional regulator